MVLPRIWGASPLQTPRPSSPCSARQDPLLHRPPPVPPPPLAIGSAVSFESRRALFTQLFSARDKNLHRDSSRAFAGSSRALYRIENESSVRKVMASIDHTASSTLSTSVQYGLLIQNLNDIHDILFGNYLVRLERDILMHIERLGALKLFHACLSRTLTLPRTEESDLSLAKSLECCNLEVPLDEQNTEEVVRSGKNKERKLKRIRASKRASGELTLPLLNSVNEQIPPSGLRSGRLFTARKESKMSEGVKEVKNLERTLEKLEKESGLPASYARWAEAARIDRNTLRQHLLLGWICRDKLLKSTRSLVNYIARNYRGMGVAFDDLLQAGNVGVLNGAERFDSKKGYKFSTYVQYWIRKAILALIAQHSRGVKIPVRMESLIKRIQKTRRALHMKTGKYPIEEEIASFTGLSLANVRLAMKCSRPVGSINQDIRSEWKTKFSEITPDPSTKAPAEIFSKQQLRDDLSIVLEEELRPRERQVLVLRYGLGDGRCKSLDEIGKLLHVSKECIRKAEKRAMSKLRREDIRRALQSYLYL